MFYKSTYPMIVEESEPALQLVGFDAGGGEIYHLNGEPFTGMIIFRNSDGIKETEVSFVSGYVCGVIREYYLNGMMAAEYKMKLNRNYGILTEWDEKGNSTVTEIGPEP